MYNQSSSSSNFIDGIPPVPGGEGMWNAASRTISSPHQHTTRGSGSDISPQADGLTPGSSDGKGTKRDRPSNGMIAKKEEEGEPPPKKPKTTRGARACMVCRRLKMRCVPRMEDGVDVGPPCKRCSNGGHECIFEESQRGKRSNKKHDAMASSLKKMEQTLDVVLKSISHPGVMASSAGMLTGTPPIAPITLSPTTRPLPVAIDPRLDDDSRRGRSSTQPSVRDASREKPPSPRLHSLPDNTLNPLGLLAEASLQNSRKQQRKENESPLLSQNGEVAAVLEVERERRDDDPLALFRLYKDTTTPSGLNPHLDYTMLLRTFSTQIDSWRDEWSVPIEALAQLRAPHYWAAIKMFYYHYYKLLLLSFGFQNALDKRDNENETIDLNGLFLQCFENASGIIRIGKDILGPRNHLRYATDAQFVFLSYAAVFLLKCIRPDFESICSETRLLLLVQEVIDLFESVAVDDTHTPALYAKFLKMLLEGRRGTGTRAAGTREGSLVAGQETNVVGQEGNALGLESVVKNFAIQQQPQGGMGMDMNADGGTFVNGNANGSFNLATDAEMDNFLDQQGLWNNFLFPGFGSQFELSAGGAAFGGLPMENAPWDVGNMSGGGGMGAWTPGEMESGTFASWS
ncbi:hypothetical protein BT69DRAFT_1278266 [Atractiella rhizophila]|nr:hypothetical protein BT69DRAFT_1278266 [Atractiella rhizophila]